MATSTILFILPLKADDLILCLPITGAIAEYRFGGNLGLCI